MVSIVYLGNTLSDLKKINIANLNWSFCQASNVKITNKTLGKNNYEELY